MSWITSVWTEAHREWRDVRGRPLGEVNSEGYAAVETQEAPCPYPDHRAQYALPMNRSALDQAVSVWPEVLDHVRAVGQRHAARPMTIANAWLAATECKWLALAAHDTTGEIPDAHAALYKTMLGYARLFLSIGLLTPTHRDTPLSEWLDSERFWGFVDEGHWLVGQRQVCAGTRKHIVAGYQALTVNEGPPGRALAAPEGYDAALAKAQGLELLLAFSAARVREALLAGDLAAVPGYGEPEPNTSRWPQVARFALGRRHRVAALIGAFPRVTTHDVIALWQATGLDMPTVLRDAPSLDTLDQLLATQTV